MYELFELIWKKKFIKIININLFVDFCMVGLIWLKLVKDDGVLVLLIEGLVLLVMVMGG